MEAYFTNNQHHHAWLPPNSHTHDPQTAQTPGTAQGIVQNGGNEEWGKTAAAIDLTDFGLGVGDLQAAPSPSPTSVGSMQQLYSNFPANGFFPPIAPYGMVPYASGSASAWPQQNIPISSYSTLNGATSSIGSPPSSSSSSQQQQPQAPAQSQVQQSVIDPALTSSSSTPSYSPPPSSSSQNAAPRSPTMQFMNAFQQQQHQLQQQQQHQQHSHSPTSVMSPLYFIQQQQQLQQQQQQQQQQRTLNPQQLNMGYQQYMYPVQQQQQHISTPMQTNLTASSSQSPSPASTSLADQKVAAPEPPDPAKFKQALNQLLTPAALSDASTVPHLMKTIHDFGYTRVTPETRIEFASRIRDGAGNAFFAAWANNDDAMVLHVNWLKAGVLGKDEGHWESTIMPLLHVLDRLPLDLEQLTQYRPGKLISKLLKSNAAPAIKDMASNISKKWRKQIEGGQDKSKDTSSSSATLKKVEIEDKTKKRKLPESASRPPTKVSVVSGGVGAAGGARAVKVKKEKVVVTAVKDAKADASFFSAPKPKPRLPSFKKAPPPAGSSFNGAGANDKLNVAQPSNENPFQQALKEMSKGRAGTTASSSSTSAHPVSSSGTVSSAGTTSTSTSALEPTKSVKKRKSVTWAAEGQLEQVKLIEKAEYDDEPSGTQSAHSIRDLERAEGAAMHIHLFEESIDWYEPQPLEYPEEIDSTERGAQSQEKTIQEEREKNALGALYFDGSQIPDTPGEPASQIPLDQVDREVRTMVAGPEIQPFFQHAMSVSDLVSQLAVGPGNTAPGTFENGAGIGGGDITMTDSTFAGGFDLGKLDPSALSSLAASLGLAGFNFGSAAVAAAAPALDTNGYAAQSASGWGAYNQHQQPPQQQAYADSGYTINDRDHDERSGRGNFRGRGRGTGAQRGRGGGGGGETKSRKRCNFYAQGSCRFGDTCHFTHDGPPGQGYYD